MSDMHTLPSQVRPSDYQSDLDNRCVWGLYEMEGVRASWIFIMTSPVYWLWYGGHTQVRLSGLQELGREEGGSILIAHIRDIKESAGSRQLDRYARLCNRTPYPTRESSDSVQRSWVRLYMKNRLWEVEIDPIVEHHTPLSEIQATTHIGKSGKRTTGSNGLTSQFIYNITLRV